MIPIGHIRSKNMKTAISNIKSSREYRFAPCLFAVVTLALCAFPFAQHTQAVAPAPDGGYPGGNTAEGQQALLSLTTGTYNTVVGWFSLKTNTTGNFNTATGAGALFATSADENTATGAGALLSNTSGEGNTANGAFALFNNTDHSFNTATGFQALFTNRTGQDNTATGVQALFSMTELPVTTRHLITLLTAIMRSSAIRPAMPTAPLVRERW